MRKYFVYELKKSLLVMGVFAVVAAAIYVVTVIANAEWILKGRTQSFPLGAIIISGGAMSIIVPIWKFRYMMKKRSVDLYYSLPLSHTRILTVKFLVGLIAVFAPYTAAYWIGSFTAMAAVGKVIASVNFIWVYLATLIPMAVIYALTAFLFTRANKFLDGIAFTVMAGMALGILSAVVQEFTVASAFYIDITCYTPFGALWIVSRYFSYSLLHSRLLIGLEAQDVVGMVLITVLGVAACVGLFLFERYAKAENCEQISDSFFGYKVMIPLYAFSLAFLSALYSYVLVALVAAAAYAVSVLYKRTPKIGWKFAVIVLVAFIVGVALSFAAAAINDNFAAVDPESWSY